MSLADIKNSKGGKSNLIVDGMVQLETAELLGKVVTVINVDIINTKNGRCGVMLFREFEDSFYFAGSVLTNLCERLLEDPEAMDELKKDGLKISIFTAKSKTGRSYTTFSFVD